jgi:hypothetical protein
VKEGGGGEGEREKKRAVAFVLSNQVCAFKFQIKLYFCVFKVLCCSVLVLRTSSSVLVLGCVFITALPIIIKTVRVGGGLG